MEGEKGTNQEGQGKEMLDNQGEDDADGKHNLNNTSEGHIAINDLRKGHCQLSYSTPIDYKFRNCGIVIMHIQSFTQNLILLSRVWMMLYLLRRFSAV